MDLRKALDQYLEGAITYAELINVITAHYLQAQLDNPDICQSCSSQLKK